MNVSVPFCSLHFLFRAQIFFNDISIIIENHLPVQWAISQYKHTSPYEEHLIYHKICKYTNLVMSENHNKIILIMSGKFNTNVCINE